MAAIASGGAGVGPSGKASSGGPHGRATTSPGHVVTGTDVVRGTQGIGRMAGKFVMAAEALMTPGTRVAVIPWPPALSIADLKAAYFRVTNSGRLAAEALKVAGLIAMDGDITPKGLVNGQGILRAGGNLVIVTNDRQAPQKFAAWLTDATPGQILALGFRGERRGMSL